jgi:magnesium chelatase family protein
MTTTTIIHTADDAHALVQRVLACRGHHVLLEKPTNHSGATALARRLHSALPAFAEGSAEHIEHSWLRHGARLPELGRQRPLRAPHHSISLPAMVGLPPHPGEVSLAHGGVLLLDEVDEHRLLVLDQLHHCLRHGTAIIWRGGQTLTLPARPWCVVAIRLDTGLSLDGIHHLTPWVREYVRLQWSQDELRAFMSSHPLRRAS